MFKRPPKPRVVEPGRGQAVIRFELPEERLPPEHSARVLDRSVDTELDKAKMIPGRRSSVPLRLGAVPGRRGYDRGLPRSHDASLRAWASQEVESCRSTSSSAAVAKRVSPRRC